MAVSDSPQCQGTVTAPTSVTVIHNFDLKRSDDLLHNAYLADSSQICLTIWLRTWVIYHNPES